MSHTVFQETDFTGKSQILFLAQDISSAPPTPHSLYLSDTSCSLLGGKRDRANSDKHQNVSGMFVARNEIIPVKRLKLLHKYGINSGKGKMSLGWGCQ